METDSTPVLIVGGGLVGLSAIRRERWSSIVRSVRRPEIPQAPPHFRLRRARVLEVLATCHGAIGYIAQDRLEPILS